MASTLGLAPGCGALAKAVPHGDRDGQAPADGGVSSQDGQTPREDGQTPPKDGETPIVDRDAWAANDGRTPSDAAQDNDSAASPKCGPTPTRIVDYWHEIPDAYASIDTPDIAVSATDLYYLLSGTPSYGGASNTRDGYLMRVPVRGGKPAVIAYLPGGGSLTTQGLAVTSTAVVFSEARGADDAGAGAILSVPLDGSTVQVLATAEGLDQTRLVADDENVYFEGFSPGNDAGEPVQSVPLTGGPVRTLAPPSASFGLGGQVLYLAYSNGTVSSVPINGGPITVLATNQGAPFYPIACGPGLCWVTLGSPINGGGALMKLAPGGMPVVLSGLGVGTYAMVFDGNNFFITGGSSGSSSLARIPADGGMGALVPGGFGALTLALHDDCLYWASSSPVAAQRGIWSQARSVADVAGSTDQ
jgi:hypothetical protein